jgi:hypothetical protein
MSLMLSFNTPYLDKPKELFNSNHLSNYLILRYLSIHFAFIICRMDKKEYFNRILNVHYGKGGNKGE